MHGFLQTWNMHGSRLKWLKADFSVIQVETTNYQSNTIKDPSTIKYHQTWSNIHQVSIINYLYYKFSSASWKSGVSHAGAAARLPLVSLVLSRTKVGRRYWRTTTGSQPAEMEYKANHDGDIMECIAKWCPNKVYKISWLKLVGWLQDLRGIYIYILLLGWSSVFVLLWVTLCRLNSNLCVGRYKVNPLVSYKMVYKPVHYKPNSESSYEWLL